MNDNNVADFSIAKQRIEQKRELEQLKKDNIIARNVVLNLYLQVDEAEKEFVKTKQRYEDKILKYHYYRPISELKSILFEDDIYEYVPYIFRLIYKHKNKQQITTIDSIGCRVYKVNEDEIRIKIIPFQYKILEKNMLGFLDLTLATPEGETYER